MRTSKAVHLAVREALGTCLSESIELDHTGAPVYASMHELRELIRAHVWRTIGPASDHRPIFEAYMMGVMECITIDLPAGRFTLWGERV